jgi:hypothetical protein
MRQVQSRLSELYVGFVLHVVPLSIFDLPDACSTKPPPFPRGDEKTE